MFQELIQLVKTWGLMGVFAATLLESVIAPIPSSLVILGVSMALTQGLDPNGIPMMILEISLVGASGQTLGAYLGYSIGYLGGRPVIKRWGRYLGLEWESIQARSRTLDSIKHGLGLLALRASPIIPLSLISGLAGAIRLNWRFFGFWTFLGTLLRCLSLSSMGWMLGIGVGEILERAEDLMWILILGGMVCYLWIKRRIGSWSNR